ncbi:restriction system-associated AAA family ATPase [Flavisolibacter nicotianae]|uniref:restriction system-associated AAA family ATPase n=1 Tax=Flavisolibacter nicotianae TaxID=2364882 RepID=UPI000EAB8834|nr:restriction system-associated AAA family ATPase [Flavisolibacter nicotianae]
MKILSIQLADIFNSLQPFEAINLSHVPREDNKIDPICLIGINGSGKSNLLELIVEIFYYVESLHRFGRNKPKTIKKLEIVYTLQRVKNKKIKISTLNSSSPKIYTTPDDAEKWTEIKSSKAILDCLPTKVVGYTSGMNETLSFRLNQLDEEYSEDVRINAKLKSTKPVPDNRMIFLDYESNEAIVASNFLFRTSTDLDVFNDLLRIKGLDSFRLIINLKRKGKSGRGNFVILSNELQNNLDKLRRCSVCNIWQAEEGYFEFDFLNTEATKQAFRDHFGSVYNLFMAFQKFELLNSLNLEKKYRKTVTKDDITDNKPTLAREDKVFRFEEIQLNISKPEKTIPYFGISDGEHQFLQIIGAIMIFQQEDVLFLLDEPETHFNPTWRTKFIHIINEQMKGRDQELVLTTHSPFVVSDCKGYRVFKFIRIDDKVSFDEIGIETFGTSFDVILRKAFDIKETISEEAISEIKTLLGSDNKEDIQEFVDNTGPSFEKLALLKHLKELNSED